MSDWCEYTIQGDTNTVTIEFRREPRGTASVTGCYNMTFSDHEGTKYAWVNNGFITYPRSREEQPVHEWIKADPMKEGTWYAHYSLTLSFRI